MCNYNMTKEEEQITSMYEKGLSARQVAERLDLKIDRVKYVCKKFKVRRITLKLTCKHCGKKFDTLNNRHKFCSESCRGKHNKRNRGIKQVCKWCNNKFTRYKEQEFCSNECFSSYSDYNNKRNGLLERLVRALDTSRHAHCEHCNAYFYKRQTVSKYCSSECYYEGNAVRAVYVHNCHECGKQYTDNIKRSAGCSATCKRKRKNRIDELRRDQRIKNNGPVDWDISIHGLIKKDGTLCYICEQDVNLDDFELTKEGHFIAGNYYPSIDHIIPLSKGGTHQWENVKLAHRICNTLKSDEYQEKETCL